MPPQQSDFDDEAPPPPQMNTSLDSILVVDGLPIVPKEKYDKLLNVIKKFFGQVGTISAGGLTMPQDEEGKSKGYAFVELATGEEAKAAVTKTNGYKLDKHHTFIVNTLEEVEKFLSVTDEYEPSEPPEYKPKEHLHSWLMDPRARDQFVIRHSDETEVWWNDANQKPEMEYNRKNWTDTYVTWSPHGTYLATFHRLGIVMWGGKSWNKLTRFNHPGVKLLDFSPCEGFLVTFSPEGDQSQAVVVWDVSTGNRIRAFPAQDDHGGQMNWPVFKWSSNDEFLARIGEHCIHVYESSTMKLIKDHQDKRAALKIEGVMDFQWSPAENYMSVWVPELGNNPARVTLLEIPSRKEIRQKNLFSVADCRMHWQSQGHFLCVKVDRHSKSKKTINTSFELFRVRDKNCPVEVVEIPTNIIAFAWEPKGIRFAIIHGDGAKSDISFYTMGTKTSGQCKCIKTLEKKGHNCLFWSPQGKIILLAGLKNMSGELEWYNVEDMESMGADEHFMCTDIMWDPTGRYVCTFVSHWRHQMENGYTIWSFQGKMINRFPKDKFYQLLWRPRPPSLLSEEKEKEVRKNLRQYADKYQKEDARMKNTMQEDQQKQRKKMQEEFEAYLMQKGEEYAADRQARIDLRGGLESDNESDYTYVEELDEQSISTKEEVVDMD